MVPGRVRSWICPPGSAGLVNESDGFNHFVETLGAYQEPGDQVLGLVGRDGDDFD